jgi:transposase
LTTAVRRPLAAEGSPAVPKKYVVALTAEERDRLSRLIASGQTFARALAHARVLLKADQSPGGPAWDDAHIAEAFDLGPRTVARVRRRFAEQGLDAALERKPPDGSGKRRKLGERAEAALRALAGSAPPRGHPAWTFRLLAHRLAELGLVESVSDETVRRALRRDGRAVPLRAKPRHTSRGSGEGGPAGEEPLRHDGCLQREPPTPGVNWSEAASPGSGPPVTS